MRYDCCVCAPCSPLLHSSPTLAAYPLNIVPTIACFTYLAKRALLILLTSLTALEWLSTEIGGERVARCSAARDMLSGQTDSPEPPVLSGLRSSMMLEIFSFVGIMMHKYHHYYRGRAEGNYADSAKLTGAEDLRFF